MAEGFVITDEKATKLREILLDTDVSLLYGINDADKTKTILKYLVEVARDIVLFDHTEDMVNRIFNDLDGLESELDIKIEDVARGIITGVICTFVITEKEHYHWKRSAAFRIKSIMN